MTLRELRGAVAAGLAIGLATGLALAALAAGAWAGEYHVYSCRTPTGQVAPTDGWSASEHPAYDPTLNTCASGGGLIAALDAGYAHDPDSETDKATWAFKAPEGETIVGATLWRAGDIAGGGNKNASYLFWLSGGAALGASVHIFDECVAGEGCVSEGSLTNPLAPENRVVAPNSALNTQYLALSTYCGSPIENMDCPAGTGDSKGYESAIELFAADLTLSQPTGPTVSAVNGGLAEDPTVSGTSDVAFHATDPGSGVYEAIVKVDGETIAHQVLNEEAGRCHNLGGTSDGLPAFLYTQPCPAEASADLPLDTTALVNGPHHLVVTVTDAAGNAATVLDREITVANQLPPGCAASVVAGASAGAGAGAGAPSAGETVALTASWKSHAGPRLRARYGAAHTIAGRLTGAGGAPIAAAAVEVCELPAYRGAPTTLLAVLHTDASGEWSLALPRDLPSSTLRIAYRNHPLPAQPTALRTLTLTVPAALRLHISPRTASVGGAIHFSGSLRGGPLPPGGKQLVLEARSPGGPWIEFHVIRTHNHGRFAYPYRFHLPGPAHYQFRVLCEAEADFPFAAGVSNVVGVFER
jgi:hypothetical protein